MLRHFTRSIIYVYVRLCECVCVRTCACMCFCVRVNTMPIVKLLSLFNLKYCISLIRIYFLMHIYKRSTNQEELMEILISCQHKV